MSRFFVTAALLVIMAGAVFMEQVPGGESDEQPANAQIQELADQVKNDTIPKLQGFDVKEWKALSYKTKTTNGTQYIIKVAINDKEWIHVRAEPTGNVTANSSSEGGNSTSDASAAGGNSTSDASAAGGNSTSDASAAGGNSTSDASAAGGNSTSEASTGGADATTEASTGGANASSEASAAGANASSEAAAAGGEATTVASAGADNSTTAASSTEAAAPKAA